MKIIKRFWWIPVILILAAGGYLYYQNTQLQQRRAAFTNQAQTVRLTRGTITSVTSATGSVRSSQNATINWTVSGQVGKVLVKIGDKVKNGQVLASLDPNSLPQNVLQAQSDLITAQQALDDLKSSKVSMAQAQQALATAQTNLTTAQQARAQLNYVRGSADTIASAEANYQLSLNNLNKVQQLYDRVSGRPENDPVRLNALANLETAKTASAKALISVNWYKGKPSTQDISTSDAALALAQATYDDALRTWNRVKDGPTPDQLAAAQNKVTAAQELIDSVNLTAPFDGTVTDLSIKPGDLVSQGTAAVRVDDLSNIYIDLQVSEVDINKIQNGQDAQLTFDAIPEQTYNGKVVQVGQVGTTSSGVVNYTVTVQITDADQQVKSGMTAAANITTSSLTNALLVPTRAIRVVGTAHEVYVRRGAQNVPVQVQVGLTSDTMSQIVSGNVQEGDQVLANPTTTLAAAAANRGGFGLFGLFGGGARPAGGGGFGGGGGGQRPAGAGGNGAGGTGGNGGQRPAGGGNGGGG